MVVDDIAVTRTVERVAREAYGRLLAMLAYRFRDIEAAEDALGDALREALERWTTDGVPESPEAWLTVVAKNRLRERARRRTTAEDPRVTGALTEMVCSLDGERRAAVDHRLDLMFVCAHPSIDPAIRTPLMLQTVLGLDAARIGDAFFVSGATMGQRLVRAKQKIRDARVPFDPPDARELAPRLHAVLEGIYAAFGVGWSLGVETPESSTAEGQGAERMDEEALFLARLLADLLPSEPEALGLLALMTFSHARRKARFDDSGAFVPLAHHDVSRWDRDSIVSAERTLLRAASLRQPGPFQLEAAIQSAHCQRLFSGNTPWSAIAILYEVLNRNAPTVATLVAHAASLAELGRYEEAEARLASAATANVESYAPYWVVVDHIAVLRGDVDPERSALRHAISLTRAPALRRYLEAKWTSDAKR